MAEDPSPPTEQHSASEPPRPVGQVRAEYPDTAISQGEEGEVVVLVEVGADGAVLSIRVDGGPAVFHEAALAAARDLEFAPATLDGVAVAGTAKLMVLFVPPDPTHEAVHPAAGVHDGAHVMEGIHVVVHRDDPDPDREDTRSRTTMQEADLERAVGDDLAETVSRVAGVLAAGGTSDSTKPLIRGQQERRLLVLYDGVRHESQKWGPDHGTEIDPFSAGSISVIRGAAGARFGPDAIGGVILVEPPALRTSPGVGGKALASFASNGLRPYIALRLDGSPAPAPGLSLRVEANAAVGSSRVAPAYVLGNTASRSWNLGGAVGYRWGRGQVRASWHHHDTRAGVFYGVRNSTLGEFRGQLDDERPVSADLWSITPAIGRPSQAVTHDVGVVQARFQVPPGSIEAKYAFQVNHRREFESVRSSVTRAQYDFTLRTHSVDVLFKHRTVALPFGTLKGGAGVQGSFQENVYRGLTLIPGFRRFGGGLFGFERLSLARVHLEVGARFDGLVQGAFLPTRDFQAHVRRETLGEEDCEPRAETVRCSTAYPAGSASFGVLVEVLPEHLDLKMDLSTASRFPNIDELYLLGTSPSFPVYAAGFPSLGVETAWGATLTLVARAKLVALEVSGFSQLVDDFIYFSPDIGPSGQPRVDVTVRGAWPSYVYTPIDAIFYGVDGTVSIWPTGPFGLEARGSIVRSVDRATGEHLVGTPADQVQVSLVGRPPAAGPFQDTELRLTTDIVGKQTRVDPASDLAPAPDGYMLLGASFETTVGSVRPVRIGVSGHNLTNTAYREYTSLLRYYADQPGLDVRVRIGIDF